jgi:hypothetical protein
VAKLRCVEAWDQVSLHDFFNWIEQLTLGSFTGLDHRILRKG